MRTAPFCCQPVIAAGRTRFIDGLIVRNKITFGISRTSVKCTLSFAAFTLDNIADDTFRAFDSGRDLPRVFAGRIPTASDKFSESARAKKQFAFFALGTNFA